MNIPLEESIEKWRDILGGTGKDEGTSNCALCQVYYDEGCSDCPVYEFTGESSCDDSPYERWAAHIAKKHRKNNHEPWSYGIECDTCKALAKAELDFLIGLR